MADPNTSNLQEQITHYEETWSDVKLYQNDLSNKQNRTNLKNSIRQMSELSHQIQDNLDKTPDSDEKCLIQQRFDTVNQEFSENESTLRTQIRVAEESFESKNQEFQGDEGYNQYDMQQQDDELDEIEYISQVATELVAQMKELKRINDETHQKIQEQHHILPRVDQMNKVAANDMKVGNEKIKKAEEDQKKRCNIM